MTVELTKTSMTLATLLADQHHTKICPSVLVSGIASNSHDVAPGYVFVALKGLTENGLDYIPQAIELGAAAILVDFADINSVSTYLSDQTDLRLIPIVGVHSLRLSLSSIAGKFYDNPSHRLRLVAVTGTNGKTTCAQLYADISSRLKTVLSAEAGESGFVGTLGHGVANKPNVSLSVESDQPSLKSPLTTPDAISLQRILADLESKGCNEVALEASSHALAQGRIAGLLIDTAIFTNLSRDHLDYHGDLETYAAAKRSLFSMHGVKNAVINIDDSVGKSILLSLDPAIRAVTFSLENITADIYCRKISLTPRGISALIQTPWGSGQVSSNLLGKFNLSNLLAIIAAAVLQASGSEYKNFTKILALLPQLKPVVGRMEMVSSNKGPAVIVDYAHTPDALDKALHALRLHCKGQLWVVFGCGGDRDTGKRKEMGAVASKSADQIIVTSDNPRTEAPSKIIDNIVSGTVGKINLEQDRRVAINLAITKAAQDDIVLIAGKGHENYQIIGNERFPFSDQLEAQLALSMVDSGNSFGVLN